MKSLVFACELATAFVVGHAWGFWWGVLAFFTGPIWWAYWLYLMVTPTLRTHGILP